MVADNSSQLPFNRCLIPDLPEEIQQQMRSIGNYVFNTLGIVAAIISFLCNSLVIATVAQTKTLQRPSLIMLCSLAGTDVMYSPFSVYRYIEMLTHEQMCPNIQPFVSSMSTLCTLATLGNLAVISRDRYVAVRRPLWYRTHVATSRAIKAICLPWLISAIIASVVYLSLKWRGIFLPLAQISCLLFYAINACVIVFYYLSIYFRKTTPLAGYQIRAAVEREKQITNTVAWILVILVLTFLPAVLFPIVMFTKGVKNVQPFRPFYLFFFQLNGLLNPLLNFGRCKEIRKALIALFKRSPQVQPSSYNRTGHNDTNSNINKNISNNQNSNISTNDDDNKNNSNISDNKNNNCNNKNNSNNDNINEDINDDNNDNNCDAVNDCQQQRH